jgi:hypothetical protein
MYRVVSASFLGDLIRSRALCVDPSDERRMMVSSGNTQDLDAAFAKHAVLNSITHFNQGCGYTYFPKTSYMLNK